MHLRTLDGDVTEIEIHSIKAATDTTEDDARAWHSSTPNDEIAELVDAIAGLSGFDVDAGKADAEGLLSANLTELISSLQKISDALSTKSGS